MAPFIVHYIANEGCNRWFTFFHYNAKATGTNQEIYVGLNYRTSFYLIQIRNARRRVRNNIIVFFELRSKTQWNLVKQLVVKPNKTKLLILSSRNLNVVISKRECRYIRVRKVSFWRRLAALTVDMLQGLLSTGGII